MKILNLKILFVIFISLAFCGEAEKYTFIYGNLGVVNIGEKWRSFNWDVKEIDGHDIAQILAAFNYVSEKPKLILANTIKGKGFSFSENNNDWHHKIMPRKQYDDALKELNVSK